MKWIKTFSIRRDLTIINKNMLLIQYFDGWGEHHAISARRWRKCHRAPTMKKMLSRRDSEEHAISECLIFRTFQMHVTLHRIDRFQRFSSQIKSLTFYFNLRWAYSSPSRRDSIFFIIAARWHLLQRRAGIAWCSSQPSIHKDNQYYNQPIIVIYTGFRKYLNVVSFNNPTKEMRVINFFYWIIVTYIIIITQMHSYEQS